METPDLQLAEQLNALNGQLEQRQRKQGSIAERRRRAAAAGSFQNLQRLPEAEVAAFFDGAPLTGGDGSVNSFGASYPYIVLLFRALARSSRSTVQGEERRWLSQVFSPLLPECREQLQQLTEQEGLTVEAALGRLRWELMARQEAEVGLQAMLSEQPRLFLWDGGFSRLEKHAPAVWQQLREYALEHSVVMLGVTEEIATANLESEFFPEAELRQGVGDRELLFGLLHPGESYRNRRPTSGQGRVYLRMGSHPQVVAVDYLPEQQGELETAISYLYTITPSHGRGFPLWLDLVDAEVRLTREEVELLLAANLDPALTEVFLRPLRSQREFSANS
jgi:hypothetical protein